MSNLTSQVVEKDKAIAKKLHAQLVERRERAIDSDLSRIGMTMTVAEAGVVVLALRIFLQLDPVAP